MKPFLALLIICCSVCCYAQDQLFKKDNTKLDVKVLEITPSEIKYKLFSNPDGPMYTILKNEVALIIYKNGQHEAFADAPQPVVQTVVPVYEAVPPTIIDTGYLQVARERKKEFKNLTKCKNVIFLNSAELLNSGVGMSYFREFFQNRVDLHVPIALSFDRPLISAQYNSISAAPQGVSSMTMQKKDIDVGLGVYVNTSTMRPITHFIGPLFRYLQLSGTCIVPTFTTSSLTSSYGYTTYNTVYNCVYKQFQVLVNNGFLYRLTPHFNMMINAAFGIATSRDFTTDNPVAHTYYFSELSITPAFQLGFSFGYRF
ncbi:MAG: hypothetical protein ACXVPQ_00330 [Bacteroidia bacterium]